MSIYIENIKVKSYRSKTAKQKGRRTQFYESVMKSKEMKTD